MKIVLFLLVAVASVIGMGIYGNEHGSGGDSKPPEYGSAWFLGSDKTIKVCTESSTEFYLKKEEIDQAIVDGFDIWAKYFVDKKLPIQFSYNTKKETPTFLYQILAACDGTEDLKIYLGINTDEVEKAKLEFVNPLAFSHRSTYDMVTGWGKGFIWFASTWNGEQWKSRKKFTALLVHELGHVFGCDHVAGTIMSEKIVDKIGSIAYDPWPKDNLAKIDQQRELVLSSYAQFEYEGNLSPGGEHEEKIQERYKLLTGRDLVGSAYDLKAKIKEEYSWIEVTITDGKGDEVVKFPYNILGPSFPSQTKVFRVVRELNAGNGKKMIYKKDVNGGSGHVSLNSITLKNGKTYPVMVERNSFQGAVYVTYQDGDKTEVLFVQNSPYLHE